MAVLGQFFTLPDREKDFSTIAFFGPLDLGIYRYTCPRVHKPVNIITQYSTSSVYYHEKEFCPILAWKQILEMLF